MRPGRGRPDHLTRLDHCATRFPLARRRPRSSHRPPCGSEDGKLSNICELPGETVAADIPRACGRPCPEYPRRARDHRARTTRIGPPRGGPMHAVPVARGAQPATTSTVTVTIDVGVQRHRDLGRAELLDRLVEHDLAAVDLDARAGPATAVGDVGRGDRAEELAALAGAGRDLRPASRRAAPASACAASRSRASRALAVAAHRLGLRRRRPWSPSSRAHGARGSCGRSRRRPRRGHPSGRACSTSSRSTIFIASPSPSSSAAASSLGARRPRRPRSRLERRVDTLGQLGTRRRLGRRAAARPASPRSRSVAAVAAVATAALLRCVTCRTL